MKAVYRYFDADGRLLYVGSSVHAVVRILEHAGGSSWYPDVRTVTIQQFNSAKEAEIEEIRAIRAEKPRYNIAHSAPNDLVSARELEVLEMMRRGMRVGEIAIELNLSIKTISTFRTRIVEKLGIERRERKAPRVRNSEIVACAINAGFIASSAALS